MAGIYDQLKTWARSELKYWEQAALSKVIRQIELQDGDIQELVDYFLQDAGLDPTPTNRAVPLALESNIVSSNPDSCRLTKIFNLRNVNALPDGQEIRF